MNKWRARSCSYTGSLGFTKPSILKDINFSFKVWIQWHTQIPVELWGVLGRLTKQPHIHFFKIKENSQNIEDWLFQKIASKIVLLKCWLKNNSFFNTWMRHLKILWKWENFLRVRMTRKHRVRTSRNWCAP